MQSIECRSVSVFRNRSRWSLARIPDVVSTSSNTIGVIESADLANLLRQVGFNVIGGSFREAATDIRASDGAFPVVILDVGRAGSRGWVEKQAALGYPVVVLNGDIDGTIPAGLGSPVSLPASVNTILANAGLPTVPGLNDFLLVGDGRVLKAQPSNRTAAYMRMNPSFGDRAAGAEDGHLQVGTTISNTPEENRTMSEFNTNQDPQSQFLQGQPVVALPEIPGQPVPTSAHQAYGQQTPGLLPGNIAQPQQALPQIPVPQRQQFAQQPQVQAPAVPQLQPQQVPGQYPVGYPQAQQPGYPTAAPQQQQQQQLVAQPQPVPQVQGPAIPDPFIPVQSPAFPDPQQQPSYQPAVQPLPSFPQPVQQAPAIPDPFIPVQPQAFPDPQNAFTVPAPTGMPEQPVQQPVFIPEPAAVPFSQPASQPVFAVPQLEQQPVLSAPEQQQQQPFQTFANPAPEAAQLGEPAQERATPLDLPAQRNAQPSFPTLSVPGVEVVQPSVPAPVLAPAPQFVTESIFGGDDATPTTFPQIADVPDEALRGQIIISYGGKGGVGKTTCAVLMAQRAAAAGMRVVVVDMNRGQGNIRMYLRLDNPNLPTVYHAAVSGDAAKALISPRLLRDNRDPSLPGLGFAVVMSPPGTLADPRMVTAGVYHKVIRFIQSQADLVIIDTQIVEAKDTSGLIDNVMIPLLMRGAWGLGISDMSRPGREDLLTRTKGFVQQGVDRERLLLMVNKAPSFGSAEQAEINESFLQYSTFLGAAGEDPELASAMNAGSFDVQNSTLRPILDAALYQVTGNDAFAVGQAPKKRMGFFGRRR